MLSDRRLRYLTPSQRRLRQQLRLQPPMLWTLRSAFLHSSRVSLPTPSPMSKQRQRLPQRQPLLLRRACSREQQVPAFRSLVGMYLSQLDIAGQLLLPLPTQMM